jgi:hypothetical protein
VLVAFEELLACLIATRALLRIHLVDEPADGRDAVEDLVEQILAASFLPPSILAASSLWLALPSISSSSSGMNFM